MTDHLDLGLSERYSALFVGNRAGVESLRVLDSNGLDVRLYRSSDVAVALVLGSQHTEPVLEWLRRAHAAVRGSSIIGGMATGTPMTGPAERFVDLFRTDVSNVPALQTRPGADRLAVVVDISREEALILAPVELSASLYLGAPMHPNLTLTKHKTPRPAEGSNRSPRQYDPIGSQVSEVVNRKIVATRSALDSLATEAGESEWPSLVRGVGHVGVIVEQRIASLQAHKYERTPRTAYEIDSLSDLLSEVDDRCAILKRAIHEASSDIDPWRDEGTYVDVARVSALVAARRFAQSVQGRLALSSPADVLPVFEHQLAIDPDPLGLRRLDQTSDSDLSVNLLYLPSSWVFRLGAFPLIAHEMAHLVMPYRISAMEGSFREWLDSDHPRAVQLRQGEPPEGEDGWDRDDQRSHWVVELLCDAVASAVCGPAYVFAMCRFSPRSFSDFLGYERWISYTHPPFSLRLAICLDTLSLESLHQHFRSDYVEHSTVVLPECISSFVNEVVSAPYSEAEYERAVADLLPTLIDGRPVAADPVDVFNALWAAVGESIGYANELAVAWSVSDIRDVRP